MRDIVNKLPDPLFQAVHFLLHKNETVALAVFRRRRIPPGIRQHPKYFLRHSFRLIIPDTPAELDTVKHSLRLQRKTFRIVLLHIRHIILRNTDCPLRTDSHTVPALKTFLLYVGFSFYNNILRNAVRRAQTAADTFLLVDYYHLVPPLLLSHTSGIFPP